MTGSIALPHSPPGLALPASLDMAVLGPEICAPFYVRRVRAAQVLWRNDGWFLRAGLDVRNPDVADQIDRWLLDNFGVESCQANQASDALRMGADRYGGTGGAAHGGSGRTGVLGGFNAKGVGRTPLVPEGIDAAHASGVLPLHEALSEAIASEIAAAELPFGAVTTLAILVLDDLADKRQQPRAVVVRENVIRPAHLERSIFFGTSGFAGADQVVDAVRVRDAVHALVAKPAPFDPIACFSRYARQIGHQRAHRLWQGRFLTSNVAIDGRLIDFGAFRSLPSWRRAVGDANERFGEEAEWLSAGAFSVIHYVEKYAKGSYRAPSPRMAIAQLNAELERGFVDACAQALGMGEVGHSRAAMACLQFLQHHYRAQQRQTMHLGDRASWRRPWLGDAATKTARNQKPAEDTREFGSLLRAAAGPDASGRQALVSAAARWLAPRPTLYQEVYKPAAQRVCAHLGRGASQDRARVSRYIDLAISRGRRLWPGLPAAFLPTAFITQGASQALLGQFEGRRAVRVSGPLINGALELFGRRYPADQLSAHQAHGSGIAVGAITRDNHDGGLEARVGDLLVSLPAPVAQLPAYFQGA